MSTNKLVGGILLIIGTCIGGSILALPLVTAGGNILQTSFLLVSIWLVMTLGAFLILEINLWLPEGSNLLTMAKSTLGPWGRLITWVVYLLLLYALVSAYIAGGGDLVHHLLALIHIEVPNWIDTLLFLLIFGLIIYIGIQAVDWANRGLLTIKLIAFFLLILLMIPHIRMDTLQVAHPHFIAYAIMPIVNSFGFAIMIPSLRRYFHSNAKALRLAVAIGSLIPLICYFLWIIAVQGVVSSEGSQGLIQMAQSDRAISELSSALSAQLNNYTINLMVNIFVLISITTSFLGVSLCLTDFLADGLSLPKQGKNKWLILALAFGPLLLIVLIHPGIFISALSYAGVTCVLLLMLLPALMAYSGRYIKKITTSGPFYCQKGFLFFEIFIAIGLLIFAISQIH